MGTTYHHGHVRLTSDGLNGFLAKPLLVLYASLRQLRVLGCGKEILKFR